MNAKIKGTEIEKEIYKHLPAGKSDDIVVHRSSSGVVVATSRLPSREGCKGGFHSAIDRPYETVGEISRLTPIIKKIKENYFNEIFQEKFMSLDEDKNKKRLRQVQQKTEKQKEKLNLLKVSKDNIKVLLKSEIDKSANRLQKSRYGYSTKNSNEEIIPDIVILNNVEKKQIQVNKAWELIKKRERNKSFEEKLKFYVESPRMTRRTYLTDHLPWKKPDNPQLPSTPENNKNYPRAYRRITRNNTIIKHKNDQRRATMEIAYLNHPNCLGNQGTTLLIQILQDEEKNYQTSKGEITLFNEIVKKRISVTEKGTPKSNVERYALRKLFNQPVPKAEELISNYFHLTQSEEL